MNNALTKTLTAGLMHGLKCKTPLGIMQLTQINMAEKWKYWFGYDHKINSKHFNAEICIREGLVSKGFNSKQIKPYLFPMSSLTKEIDQLFPENETETYSIKSSSSHICITGIDKEDGEEIDLYLWMDEVHNWPFWIIEELIKRHYNVFGLSPEEFIEVNETSNPYKV